MVTNMVKELLVNLRNKLFGVNAGLAAINELKQELLTIENSLEFQKSSMIRSDEQKFNSIKTANNELLNEKNKLIDEKNKLINDNTLLIDEKNKLIDKKNKLINDNTLLIDEKNKLINDNTLSINEQNKLKSYLHQLIFEDITSTTETNLPDGLEKNTLPLPHKLLRYLVTGTEDLEWFLKSGKFGQQTVLEILKKNNIVFDQGQKVLDFGCGCGRVLRHFNGISGIKLYGTDCNSMAIQWCQRYLDCASFTVNGLNPPLEYADGSFNLIYSFSIFTHLTEPLQLSWMSEFRRILAPGGYLIISVNGDATLNKYPHRLSSSERENYNQGDLVVKKQDLVGSNFCQTYHPEKYVRHILGKGFEVIDFIPGGAKGNPPQDAYLLQLSSC